MIRASISNLRSPDWQPVDRCDLKTRIQYDETYDSDQWKVTPWQRNGGPNPHRSYLVTSQGGGVYAIFFRKT